MKRIMIVLLLAVCCLAGCKAEPKKQAEEEDSAAIFTRGQAFAKEGITFVKDSIVQYADFATGETRPLCSRLDCPHRIRTFDEIENGAEQCVAYVENAFQAALYREKMYVFTDTGNKLRIYVLNLDGSNKRCLTEIVGAQFTGGFSTEFYGNHLVLLTSGRNVSKKEDDSVEIVTIYRLYMIDCENGATVACEQEWKQHPTIAGVDESAVYLYHTYVDDAIYEKYTSAEIYANPELQEEYKHYELWKCAMGEEKAEELEHGRFNAAANLSTARKNGAVIRKNEDGTEKMVYLSLQSGEETEMISASCRVLCMDEERVLLTATETVEDRTVNVIYSFSIKDGNVKKEEIAPEVIPVRMLGGNLYCLKEGGKNCVMSLEDVLAGKNEVIYQMEYVLYDTIR